VRDGGSGPRDAHGSADHIGLFQFCATGSNDHDEGSGNANDEGSGNDHDEGARNDHDEGHDHDLDLDLDHVHDHDDHDRPVAPVWVGSEY
jgi:hypothetical protein